VKLLVLGYHVYPARLSDHELNAKTWRSISRFFARIDIIAQSSDARFHRDQMGNVHVIESPRTGIRGLDVILYMITAFLWGIKSLACGVGIVECSEAVVAGPIGILLGRIGSIAVIVHIQGEVLTLSTKAYPLENMIRRISSWVCLRANRVRVVSEKIRRSAQQLCIQHEIIILVPNRVDTRQFRPQTKSVGTVGRNDRVRFLFVGSLIPVKDVRTLLYAFQIVKDQIDNSELHIVGSGPERHSLSALVSELGLQESVHFHGRVKHSKMPTYFNKSDVFVLSSLSEGMPRVILEAMASGIPIVSTDVGGLSEILTNGKTGILVPSRDSKALAGGMIRLVSSPLMAQKIAGNALKVVRERHEWDKNIRKIVRFIIGRNAF
jgi:glycosyltransferase involved in cell wall biosynthesis